eukprot:44194-Eustigmatos_ZCMA.PRE.1
MENDAIFKCIAADRQHEPDCLNDSDCEPTVRLAKNLKLASRIEAFAWTLDDLKLASRIEVSPWTQDRTELAASFIR